MKTFVGDTNYVSSGSVHWNINGLVYVWINVCKPYIVYSVLYTNYKTEVCATLIEKFGFNIKFPLDGLYFKPNDQHTNIDCRREYFFVHIYFGFDTIFTHTVHTQKILRTATITTATNKNDNNHKKKKRMTEEEKRQKGKNWDRVNILWSLPKQHLHSPFSLSLFPFPFHLLILSSSLSRVHAICFKAAWIIYIP